ncbi:MAG: SdrD B-like domain-containing protein, partial [Desertimonas sp.]
MTEGTDPSATSTTEVTSTTVDESTTTTSDPSATTTTEVASSSSVTTTTIDEGGGIFGPLALIEEQVISNVRIVEESTGPYSTMRIELDWAVPDSAVGGDNFTLTLPTNLRVQAFSFPLRDAAGNVVANATVTPGPNGGGEVDFVLTDYANTHNNVGGTAFFQSRWNQSEIVPGTTESVTFVSGEARWTDSVDIRIGQPTREPSKWMNWDTDPTPHLSWGVVSGELTAAMIGQTLTLVDISDPLLNPIDCDTIDFRSGYFDPLRGGVRGENELTPSASSCTPARAEYSIVITADMVDRPGDYDDVGRVISMNGQSLILNPAQTTFTNNGEVIIGGATTPVSASDTRSTGGGDGGGDIAVSVGDYVWWDADHDGLQDDTESGIEGVELTLQLLTEDGTLVTAVDTDGVPVPATQTDANGLYEFTNLPPLSGNERYVVTVTPPAGYLPTIEGGDPGVGDDSSTGSATSTLLTVDGDRDPTLDFGFWIPEPDISIVKGDTDGNTGDDRADPVLLPDGTASLIFTVTNTGSEDLINVTVSDTLVSNGAITGLVCTFPDDTTGTTWAGPLAVGASFDCTASLTDVVPGSVHEDIARVDGTGQISGTPVDDENPYHAITPVVSVGDFVWLDEDHDGIQDAGEPGIPGVTLTITGPDGAAVTDVYGNPVTTTETDGSGLYEFVNLPPLPAGQHYTVTVTPPAGYAPTIEGGEPGVGDDSSTGSATSVDLVNDGDRDPTLDFGFWIPEPDISILKGDTDGNTGDDPADPVLLADGTASLIFTVTNTGSEDLLDVT